MFPAVITLVAYTQIPNLNVKVKEELCIEEVHPGSDRTSPSVAQSQVPAQINISIRRVCRIH